MNETGKNRDDRWLFIAATTLLFRVTSFVMEIVASLLGLAHTRTDYAAFRYLLGLLPVFGPVLAVVLALLIARALEPRLQRIHPGPKRVLLVLLTLLALLPWQIHIRTAARPVPLNAPAAGIPSSRP